MILTTQQINDLSRRHQLKTVRDLLDTIQSLQTQLAAVKAHQCNCKNNHVRAEAYFRRRNPGDGQP